MTPAGREQALIDILHAVAAAPIPMDGVVGDYMRARRYIGSKDRAALADAAYDLMRHYGRLTWWADHLDITPDPRHLVLLYRALVSRWAPDQVAALYTGETYAPSPLGSDETSMLADLADAPLHHPSMPIPTTFECPPAAAPDLMALWSDDFASEMGAFLTPATLDLRINPLKTTRDAALLSLHNDGITATPTPYAPYGIRLGQKVFLSTTAGFRAGLFDIQDEGSQLIAHVCDARPGMQVLDFCAGGGGKTLALAASMNNKGRIVAMDNDPRRLEKSRLRFRRAGIADIIEVRPLDDPRHRGWFKRQKGTFDVVLVDVPCSGSGTWRRNPDTRWRQFGPTLDELTTTQAEILDRVAVAVKPGGRLVYATCSLYPRENEEQVSAFLSRHANYRVIPLPTIWPEGTPCPVKGDFMRLSPHRHQTDGFFAAVMTRVD
jgi:16S rRNA (cytosine967-C5)-methyltransferase